MNSISKYITNGILSLGEAFWFFIDIIRHIFSGHIRVGEVLKQMYQQGIQSVIIIGLTSLASGLVLALQSAVVLERFGAKEFIAPLVALSLVRELSPIFTALVFSGKAGARITAEIGTMNVNDQILATRTMGVDPIEFLIVPRFLGCLIVLPVLTIISEIIGIYGGYLIGVYEAHVPGTFYISQTIDSIRYVDFFSGFVKVFFFSVLIGWVCCYQGFVTGGGSLGVGRFTTKAVAFSYIFVIISNVLLTKIILTFWG
ncbi:MAG: phospholipid/cholesterol/gamma-HCH transport system permease protein [Candidatus Omnitrophota bacterium]|jgi:phospholipid/cholesterol/gamma-HCH transport system permease protein